MSLHKYWYYTRNIIETSLTHTSLIYASSPEAAPVLAALAAATFSPHRFPAGTSSAGITKCTIPQITPVTRGMIAMIVRKVLVVPRPNKPKYRLYKKRPNHFLNRPIQSKTHSFPNPMTRTSRTPNKLKSQLLFWVLLTSCKGIR